jgi:phosphoribosyl-ATP pyrophosphohydrolase
MTDAPHDASLAILTRLEQVIAERRETGAEASYVAKLFAKGVPKIAQKVGEEAVEAVIAAMAGDRAGLVGEAADLLFHLLVLLQAQGIALADVTDELARREGVGGLVEKAGRKAEQSQ